jgi:pyruvate dehydrogenase E2 component (dihydrolipoamide acetyltransferase)
MAVDVPMPKLGLTMEEATIIEWLVADGDVVENDQPIMLIETDKTETEVGAPSGGRLHQIGKPGETFACGQLVGEILGEGEVPARGAAPAAQAPAGPVAQPIAIVHTTTAAPAAPATAPGRIFASPNARRVAAERGVPLRAVRGTGPGGRIVSEDVLATPSAQPATRSSTTPVVVATAAARNLADLLGVDLADVAPDPVERRITREAVALHVRDLLAARTAVSDTRRVSDTGLFQEPTQTIRLTGMRGTIARRMHA